MATIRIEVNKDAVKNLLKSKEIQDDIRERAERIAAAAGDGFEVETSVGANRARAVVLTTTIDAMLAEANDRALTRAVDAGR